MERAQAARQKTVVAQQKASVRRRVVVGIEVPGVKLAALLRRVTGEVPRLNEIGAGMPTTGELDEAQLIIHAQ